MRIPANRHVLTLLLLLIPSAASANSDKPFTGVSGFAAMHPAFPCDRYLAVTNRSPRPAMSALWGTFGGETSCIVRFLQSNAHRPHLLQIHLSNETCRRNRNCQVGELFPDLTVKEYSAALERGDLAVYAQIAHRLWEIRNLAELTKNPNTTLVLDTGLEADYTQAAYEHLRYFVGLYWPYLISNSGRTRTVDGDLDENHGTRARCKGGTLIVNEDGSKPSLKDSRNFLRQNRNCFARLLWRNEHQGRGRSGKWTPPITRNFVITDRDIRDLGNLLEAE